MRREQQLPPLWVQCALGDVVDYGVTQKAEPFEIPNDAWVLELEDIEKDTSRLLQRVNFAQRQSKSTKNRFAAGDVLYGKLRPKLNKVLVADQEGYCTTEIIPLRPSSAVLGEYLCYGLKRPEFLQYAEAASHGLSMPRLGTRAGAEAPFPLAPLDEQKRIVGKLNELFALVDACRTRLDLMMAALRKFRRSVLNAATCGKLTEEWRDTHGLEPGYKAFYFPEADVFGDYEIPASWEVARLGAIASITGGVTKDARKQFPEYIEVPYLRVANVQRGFFDLSEVKTIRVPEDKLPELLLRAGDILFNEGGDIDKLGRGWVWDGQIESCTFQNHVFRARLQDSMFSPRFFSWFGNSRGLNFFFSYGKQSTNLASINKTVLSALPVPVPSVEEQCEIVRRIELLFAHADSLQARYEGAMVRLERVGPALLDKAFRGELVSHDPADHPASALLEQVRAAREELARQPKLRLPRRPKKRPEHMKTLKEALAAADDWMSAEEVFRLCGLAVADTDRIEQLYAELRELERTGALETQPINDDNGRKLYDNLRLTSRSDHAP